jgi:N-acetylglucosamine kinase-like BadF-type ATPase
LSERPSEAPDLAILAVDGGNSKTDIALVARDGRLLSAVRGPTTSHQQVGLEAGTDRLADLVAEARARAGLPAGAPDAPDAPLPDIGIYALAGADTPADEQLLLRAIGERRLARRDVVVNDAFAPIRAASEPGWGIALICGSGVNAAGIAPEGRRARLTALGPISGDWGGGGDIGLAALGLAVRARDGRGQRTALETLVPAHFGYRRPIDLTRAIEARVVLQSRLGELAPVVFRAAAEGDAVARSILDRQANELILMAGAIIRQLSLVRRRPDVVLAGGVFAARDPIFEARIRDGIQALAPGARVHRAEAVPVLGAALLGLDQLEIGPLDARREAEARLRASLGAWRPNAGAPSVESDGVAALG